MAWFDRSGQNQLFPVRFDDVTPSQRRQPSWLAKGRRPSSPPRVSVPPPPPLPSELLGAEPSILEIDATTKPNDKREAGLDTSRRISNEGSRPSMSPAEFEALVAERAAREAAEQLIVENQNAITQAVQALASAHERLSENLCERAIQLATLVARRVIARELTTHPDIVTDLVREGLEVLNVHDKVRVHLGSEFAVLKDEVSEHFAAAGTMIDVSLDATLPPFGCVVETEVGSVDESIETRLSMLLESLTNEEA